MLALSLNKNSSLKIIKKKLNKLEDDKYRVRIIYSSICASDIPRAFKRGAYSYPLIMGHEFSGKIIERGKKKKKYKIGDYVSVYPLIPKCKKCKQCRKKQFNLCEKYSYYGSRENGGFSEYIDINEWNIYKIKKTDIKLASLLEPTAVSYNIFEKLKKINKSDNILIIGCGYLGQILIRILFKNKFNNLNCVDRNSYKTQCVKKFVKKTYLNLNKLENNNFDCIVDFIGTEETFNFSLSNTSPSGKYILPANIYKNFKLHKKNLGKILRKELTIKGVWNSTYNVKNSNWDNAEKFINNNSKEIKKLITHEIKLSDAGKFFKFLRFKKKISKKTKIYKSNY